MIEFKCQHCGKGLHLNDSYAGRDGWCRVCKRMVIVPGGGPITRVEDLPPEEGYERLQRLLQYAATKADKFKVHLARQVKEQEHTARLEEALLEAQRRLSERDATEAKLRQELDAMAGVLREKEARLSDVEGTGGSSAQVSELEWELGTVRADLAIERESRQSLSMALSERDASFAALEQELAEARQSLAKYTALEESAAADRVNLHALEGATASLKSQLHQVETERDRLAVLLEEGSTGEEDRALRLMQKDREIDALQAALEEVRARQEETDRSTRDQIVALEAQVTLFEEIKERMAALQVRIRELEQERMDTSLALDSAQQSEGLLQKKIGVLETSLQTALAEQSAREMQSEQLQRELVVRDEQIRKMTGELQELTERQGEAMLAAEKSTRASRASESRAERLSAEIEAVQQAREQISMENEQLRRGMVELEARVASLNESLSAARADAAAKASHEPAAAALQAELSELKLVLQRTEEEKAGMRASLGHTVSELQAEVMNLTESLERAEAAAAVAQASEDLEASEARIAALEARLEALGETASLQQVEEEHLNQALSEARARIAELEASLAEAARLAEASASARPDDGEEDEDVGFILLNPEPRGSEESAPGPSLADVADERRRQLEKKQMMDVLSDFLNK